MLTVGVLAASAVVLTPLAAHAAPGSPGTPSGPGVVYAEDFENGMGTTPVGLASYTGATGQTYTADSVWLTNCNGQVRSFNTPYTTLGNCISTTDSSEIDQLAYALGVHAGAAVPANNHAVTAYTENNPGANAVEFRTVNNIPLASASGRFLTFSVDTAAVNCAVSAPQYQFAFLAADGSATNVGGVLNACSSPSTVTVPAVGVDGAQAVRVGTYTSNGSVLFSGSSLGIRMTNANGSGVGNDAAFDNIKILDVTPQLDKSFSPAVAPTGGVSTLTFTVTNTSELAAKSGWSFTDALPTGLTVAPLATVGGTCQATTTAAAGGTSIAVTNGTLTAGEASCTITVPVTSATPTSYTNGPGNVTVTGLNEPGNATVTFEKPALTLVKHAGTPVDVNGDGITDAGDTIQYTFTVSNSGDVPVSGIAIDDAKVGAVTCPTPTLAVGASETCTAASVYTVTAADAQAGAVDNTATATGTSPTGATVTSPPSSTSTPATVAAPALTLLKSADPSDAAAYTPGQLITYHFVVTNSGNVTMNGIAIDETAFGGSGTMSPITCPSATLAPGAQEVCTATYTLTSADVNAGSLANTAVADGTPQGSTTPVASNSSTVTIPEPAAPALTVVKTADPGTVTAAGQLITYSFTVTNTGNVTLTDPSVTETAFSGSGSLSTITCPEASLVAGQVETCTATYTVTQADVNAGTITNTAIASGTPPSGPSVASSTSSATVTATRTPALSVVKTANVTAVTMGEQITYSFAITNTGNVTITDPTVAEAGFSGTGTLSPIDCPPGVILQPGDVTTCTADYTVTQADVDSGSLTNTATATGTPPSGLTPPTSAPSTSTVTTNPLPALSLVKTASVSQVTQVGQVVTYTFVVTNTGNVDITRPQVHEGSFNGKGTLSPVTCPATATLAPGQSFDCTASYTVVAADLANGGTLSNTATVIGTTPGGGSLTSDPSTATVNEVTPAGLATTGIDPNTTGIVGFGLLVLGMAAAAVAWFRRRLIG